MSDLPKTALQKFAWYNLIVVLGAFTLTGITYVLIYFLSGAGLAKLSFAFLGLMGFLGSSGKYFNKKAGDTSVVMDERDKQIMLESGLIGFRATYLYWVVAGMLTWIIVWVIRGSTVVGVHTIPLLVGGSCLVLFLSMSFSILIRYGHEPKEIADAE